MVSDTVLQLLDELQHLYRLQKANDNGLNIVNLQRKELAESADKLNTQIIEIQIKLCELLRETADDEG